jgi:transcriptional regulator with XRE-family HTH domain
MVKLDNPVRISRLSRRLSQKQLANSADVARMTLVAIEEGTTRTPDFETMDAIARVLGDDTNALIRSLNQWHDDQPQVAYNLGRLQFPLAPPTSAASFAAWRKWVEPSATKFAQQLGVSRATLTGYESGARINGMPDTLQAGLLAIGCDLALVRELAELPPK